MYIEKKAGQLTGPARIGRVTFSRTGQSIYYKGHHFMRLGGHGYKSNYYDTATGEEYWISGCKKNGADQLYGGRLAAKIDDDVMEEYWTVIRNTKQS